MNTTLQDRVTKYDRIANAVREKIVRRELMPGTRLPSRSQFERQFNASSVTVQQAFGRLVQEGFVQVRHKRGTYVADQPPHLSKYAIVFCQRPSDDGFWSRYFSTLSQVAVSMRKQLSVDFQLFYGVDHHEDSEDFTKLVSGVKNHNYAGLIFATPPYRLLDTPVFSDPIPPCVGLMDKPMPKISAVHLNDEAVIEAALEHLAQCGRERVAVMSSGQGAFIGDRMVHLQGQLERHGMETRPYWLLAIDPHHHHAVRHAAHLLMECRQRPDALIVLDDNLEDHAAAGLLAAGVNVPGDLDVVAHCNFPWAGYPTIKVRRVGFDLRQALLTAMELIDQKRRDQPTPDLVEIDPLFDSQFQARLSRKDV